MSGTAMRLWSHVFAGQRGLLNIFSAQRFHGDVLEKIKCRYLRLPEHASEAARYAEGESAAGREVYSCAHLLTRRRRVKENATPLAALYVDGDGAKVEAQMPEPTATVATSPGREQFWWALSEPVPPKKGEELNRRLAYAMGADCSGWDLTQLLRVPGTRNRKYADAPMVVLAALSESRYEPAELEASLPRIPQSHVTDARCSARPCQQFAEPDLSRLSEPTRELVLFGNSGQYVSRSEADFAVCLAMFDAGYKEVEIWAVMADPAHAISEKFLEKGRDGELYLSLTIGKAATAVRRPRGRGGRSKARRVRRRAV
jgi:DNA primase RepB-like protein